MGDVWLIHVSQEAVDSKITFDKSECDPEKLGWILHYIYGGGTSNEYEA